MELEVIWSDFAKLKLRTIYRNYKNKAGKGIAKKLVNGIIDATIHLEKPPFLGYTEELLECFSEDFRYIVFKSYKVIYWINTFQNQIEVVHVFDARQNPDKIKEFTRG